MVSTKLVRARFVFYSLERGPFDIPRMQDYMRGLREGADEKPPHPLVLRIPPIGEDENGARKRVRQGLEAGVAAIVFPHVTTVAHAAVAVRAMGSDLWPANPNGNLVNFLIIEDRAGVENAQNIVKTPGVSVVFAGPGDLRRAYNRDMEAVEKAIQTILAACLDAGVPCGITAGPRDITKRLEQGFRVIIVTRPEALTVARKWMG